MDIFYVEHLHLFELYGRVIFNTPPIPAQPLGVRVKKPGQRIRILGKKS